MMNRHYWHQHETVRNLRYEQRRPRSHHGHIGMGILFILVGIAILLFRHIPELQSIPWWNYWPCIFIVVGVAHLIDARTPHDFRHALWWFVLGTWFFISEFHVFGLTYGTSWPILIIFAGITILWKSSARHIRISDGEEPHE